MHARSLAAALHRRRACARSPMPMRWSVATRYDDGSPDRPARAGACIPGCIRICSSSSGSSSRSSTEERAMYARARVVRAAGLASRARKNAPDASAAWRGLAPPYAQVCKRRQPVEGVLGNRRDLVAVQIPACARRGDASTRRIKKAAARRGAARTRASERASGPPQTTVHATTVHTSRRSAASSLARSLAR